MERPAGDSCSNDVPFPALVSAVAALDRLNSILDDEELSLGGQSTRPALHDRRTGVLVENSVRLEAIVWVLPHEDLGLAELDVRLGKCHCHGLVLHASDLFGPGDARFFGIERS